jgi:ADP-heptose:LPS heptosyltransferase
MQGAALHLGPDSGGLHIARLVGTPSVSWFRPNHHIVNWLPDEPGHLAFTAPESRPEGLYGLQTDSLIEAAATLLR